REPDPPRVRHPPHDGRAYTLRPRCMASKRAVRRNSAEGRALAAQPTTRAPRGDLHAEDHDRDSAAAVHPPKNGESGTADGQARPPPRPARECPACNSRSDRATREDHKSATSETTRRFRLGLSRRVGQTLVNKINLNRVSAFFTPVGRGV